MNKTLLKMSVEKLERLVEFVAELHDTKHGNHDQSTHGRGGGSSGESAALDSSSTTAGKVAGFFTKQPKESFSGPTTWKNKDGQTVSLSKSTIYGKARNLRDPKKTKMVAVIDFQGKEHKAISVVTKEEYTKEVEFGKKVVKLLRTDFGIDARSEFGYTDEELGWKS